MKKSKKKSKTIPSSILSLGHYDIDYSITLNEEDILKYHIDYIENLTSYEDIKFIVENQYLWGKMEILTENSFINLLLYLNKISINKSYIEYIAYEQPVFYNKSVKEMLMTVNDLNFLFVNDCPLNPESKKNFSLTIKYKDKQTVIDFAQLEKENNNNSNDETKKESGEENQDSNKEQNDENEKYLENENNAFNKVKIQCQKFNYFLCSIEEAVEINPFKDFIEFAVYAKLTFGALLAIEYGDISEFFGDKDSMTLLNKLYLLTDIFLFDEKDAINNFKKHYEILTKDKEKKKYLFDEHKDSQSNYDVQSIYQRSEINDDKKGQVTSLNKNNNYRASIKKKKEKDMTVKDLFEYFKRTIACNGALSILNSKLGIFIDENFSKLTFIEVPMNIKVTELSYEIKPYPKLSHITVDLVKLYKSNLSDKRPFFKSIFFSGILSKIFVTKRKTFGIEVLYTGYLVGYEILKRLLNLMTNDIPFPENSKFYIVKVDNNEVNKYVKNEFLNKKENKFVLDCTNLEKSKLKNYIPLFDYNLHEFFESKSIQKELAKKGFINSKGFVNYDPYYKKGMGMRKRKSFRNLSENPHYLIKKQVEVNMKNMSQRVLPNSPTNVKLPIIQCRVSERVNNLNKNNSNRCSHNYNQKCKYCDLYEKAKIEIDIEEERRRKMQLRRYKKD